MRWLLWLGRVGLLLDLLGAALILRGGTPPVYRPRYSVYAPDDYDPGREQEEWQAKATVWERRNRFGFWLLIAGFTLQLIGTWAGR